MSTADLNVGHIRDYDAELGAITDQDREYADDLCSDLGIAPEWNVDIIAQWFRKVRYEAVMADRKGRCR